jgi:hypothetical protein
MFDLEVNNVVKKSQLYDCNAIPFVNCPAVLTPELIHRSNDMGFDN